MWTRFVWTQTKNPSGHDNDLSTDIKYSKFIDSLSDSQLHKKRSLPWTWLLDFHIFGNLHYCEILERKGSSKMVLVGQKLTEIL
jgi:hypothetical protein